jgi:radical SAM superfamily enzyme YgiQ (UPF0313 family)
MKVALVRPPQVHPYWATKRPSLGISYLASFLISKGLESHIFDANFNSWTAEELVSRVKGYRPDLIGISAMTHEIVETNQLAGLLKKKLPHVPVVIGGCHMTALPQQTLIDFPNFDFGIYREGEKPLLALVKYWQKKTHKIGNIPNLVYRNKSGKIKINPEGPWLTAEELDQLPYPEYRSYQPLSNYPMMSSRGCPYQCAFCMQVLGHQLRRRSPENIVAEMEYAIKRFGVKEIQFCDEIFLFNDSQTRKTLNLMIKKGLPQKIRWNALTRANQVEKDLIELAKKAGCYALDLGVESGSDKILKRINKQITVAQAKKAVRIIKKAGITTFAYFILGHPGETVKTIRQTINLVVELNTDQVAAGLMVPYPGTKIWEMAQKGEYGYRLLSQDFSRYDKYGGGALESKALPLKELEKWQRRLFLEFYLRNGRFQDLARFLFVHRKEISRLVLKK